MTPELKQKIIAWAKGFLTFVIYDMISFALFSVVFFLVFSRNAVV